MTKIEELEEKYNIGQSIFKELSKLNDDDIRIKLLSIIDVKYHGVIKNDSDCVRVIRNGEPKSIDFEHWDSIMIDWSGINFVPEHGCPERIVEFNNHFKL